MGFVDGVGFVDEVWEEESGESGVLINQLQEAQPTLHAQGHHQQVL